MGVIDKKLLLDIEDLKVHFNIAAKSAWPWAKPTTLKAVDGVNIKLYEGETWVWWASPAVESLRLPVLSLAWCRQRRVRLSGWDRI